MFGRATIRLGIGPHSSFMCFCGDIVCVVDRRLLQIDESLRIDSQLMRDIESVRTACGADAIHCRYASNCYCVVVGKLKCD